MMRETSFLVRAGAAVVAAAALGAAAAGVHAAPVAYETSVLGNNPYIYYRLNDANVADESTALDTSVNGRNGIYNGGSFGTPVQTGPTGGQPGFGTSSDNAVLFTLGSGTTRQYIRTPNGRTFGSSLGSSTFEFVYKYDNSRPLGKYSLYGAYSNFTAPTPSSQVAAEVTLNSQGNDALGTFANTTRLFIRDTAGNGLGAHFTSAALYDGNYHHLVLTFDGSTLSSDGDPDGAGGNPEAFTGGFAAYVDGIPQAVTIQRVNGTAGALPATYGDDLVDPVFVGRNVRGTGIDGNGVGQLAPITLDETALYTTALSPEQVAANATALGFVVPEPGSLALAGIAGLGLLVRRRRQA
jgi:hypothetical protein